MIIDVDASAVTEAVTLGGNAMLFCDVRSAARHNNVCAACNGAGHPAKLRVFRVPKLNWEAENFSDMISWCGRITEPPATKDLSERGACQCPGPVTGTAGLPLPLSERREMRQIGDGSISVSLWL